MILCAEHITTRLPANGGGSRSIIFLCSYMAERVGAAGKWAEPINLDAPHIEESPPRLGWSFRHIILSRGHMIWDSDYMAAEFIYMERRVGSRGRRRIYIEME
jgi:hypothetical protein